jgi:hypothetical protein
VVGRHRPDPYREPLEFRPFSSEEQWHSFPSAHTVHAFSIATGVADEVRNPWVSAIAFGTAAVVGTQRVYTSAHWTSDVTASAVLAISATTTTTRWLRRHGLDGLLPPTGEEHARRELVTRSLYLTAPAPDPVVPAACWSDGRHVGAESAGRRDSGGYALTRLEPTGTGLRVWTSGSVPLSRAYALTPPTSRRPPPGRTEADRQARNAQPAHAPSRAPHGLLGTGRLRAARAAEPRSVR